MHDDEIEKKRPWYRITFSTDKFLKNANININVHNFFNIPKHV